MGRRDKRKFRQIWVITATTVQQWEGRPKASKPIDKEWRMAVSRKQRQQQAPSPTVEPIDGVDSEDAEAEEGNDGVSKTDRDTEDEFAQFIESQAEMDDGADEGEDATPWDGEMHTADRDEGVPTQKMRPRRTSSYGSATGTTEKQGCVVEQRRVAEERYGNAAGAHQDGQRAEEQDSHPGVENETPDGRTKATKRKVTTSSNRHRRRDRQRA